MGSKSITTIGNCSTLFAGDTSNFSSVVSNMDSHYIGMFPLDGKCNYTSDESIDDGNAFVAYCCEEVHDSYEYDILREDVGISTDHVLFEENACQDFGDCDRYCSSNGAMVWYEEQSNKSASSSNPDFSICCMKGKVQLPFLNSSLRIYEIESSLCFFNIGMLIVFIFML